MINYALFHFCPSPKKHVYMHDELLCSWRPTMSEEGALSVRFRDPKTFCEEEELLEKAVPSSTKYKNKWALSVFGEWQFAWTIKVPVLAFSPFCISEFSIGGWTSLALLAACCAFQTICLFLWPFKNSSYGSSAGEVTTSSTRVSST